ncbi:MAG: ribonuclease III [Nitrospinota bacterium]
MKNLQEKIGYFFKNPALLINSLTHKSYVNETSACGLRDNERLEFFGDAVLGLVISDFLFHKMPKCSEGELSKIRAGVVSEASLASIAASLGIGPCLRLGHGEENSGGRSKNSLLANAFEALIAALYIDAGYDQTYEILTVLLENKIEGFKSDETLKDFKSAVQELVQVKKYSLPVYRLARETGPDHQKRFHMELVIDGEVCGYGYGRNKKEAEQMAAKDALEKRKLGK